MKFLFTLNAFVHVCFLSSFLNGWASHFNIVSGPIHFSHYTHTAVCSVPTPTGSVTSQPTCQLPVGTISISSPLGAQYHYSLAALPYQSSPVFNNLPPGNYFVTVKDINTGEISAPLSLTVNDDPGRPAQPILSVKQPDCVVHTGTITITSPLGPGLEYSKDGGSYQVSPIFTSLPERTYTVRVRNTAGCISPITVVIILDNSIAPAAPVFTIVQPKCPLLTGTVTITSPLALSLEYSSNAGATWQTSNVFSMLPGGNYSIIARFAGTNCTSQPLPAKLDLLTAQQCLPTIVSNIYFPTAFTPNGDQVNDGFGAGPNSNLGGLSNYSLSVFNRYGELVFQTKEPFRQWDGTVKGKKAQGNTYTWIASYRFGSGQPYQQKGTVTIVR